MRRIRTFLGAGMVLLWASSHGSAHHAFAAEYDEHKRVTVSGKVTGVRWSNPHAWLYLDGKDESGKVAIWGFEMGSPNGLKNRGWKQTDVKRGDAIVVEGFQSRSTLHVANATVVTLADGRKLFGGFQSTPGNPGKK